MTKQEKKDEASISLFLYPKRIDSAAEPHKTDRHSYFTAH